MQNLGFVFEAPAFVLAWVTDEPMGQVYFIYYVKNTHLSYFLIIAFLISWMFYLLLRI